MARLSVIMPVYNAETYLAAAIRSVLCQTFTDFELIIVNDGSVDGSLAIMQEFVEQDDRIAIISRENRGLVASLNEAISVSKGEYIARMDADDICYAERFEKQVAYLDSHPQVDLVGTRFELLYEKDIDEDTRQEVQVFYRNAHEPIDYIHNKESILEGYKILHPTWMFRASLINKIGGYRQYISEDNEFLFRAAMVGCILGRVEECLFQYRISNQSVTGKNRKSRASKKSCIEFKLDYLQRQMPERFYNAEYVIWGADISGELAYEVLQSRYPQARFAGFIDGIKTGEWLGMPIYSPEEFFAGRDIDYVFIATRGGAGSAAAFLKEQGKELEKDYFKIV